MVAYLQIKGANEFGALAKRLKAAGEEGKGLRKELLRGINQAVKPLGQDVKASLGDYMPDRYAGELSGDLKVTATKRGGSNPAIRIKATSRRRNRKLKQLDAGRLKHMLFGNARHWYAQSVTPGFFTRRLSKDAPVLRRELLLVIRQVAEQITRK